jgi:hypothetical protein
MALRTACVIASVFLSVSLHLNLLFVESSPTSFHVKRKLALAMGQSFQLIAEGFYYSVFTEEVGLLRKFFLGRTCGLFGSDGIRWMRKSIFIMLS